jgi:hypothetical protein
MRVMHRTFSARRGAGLLPRAAAAALLLLSAAVAAPAAHAQLLFSLTPNVRGGTPGGSVSYTGTLTNQGSSTIFLNSLVANISDPTFSVDPFSFFSYVPATLAGGATYSGAIFDLQIETGAVPGQSGSGVVSLMGGTSGSANQTLANADFFIVVTPAPPAAAVFAVCGAAIAGAGWLRRRRQGGIRGGCS